MTRLDGKTVLVTGASSGIGRAAAALFIADGAAVVGVGADPQRTAEAAEVVGFLPLVGSVDDEELWDRALAAAADLGGLDIAYLNAGRYGFLGAIDDLPLDVYRQTLAANVDGVVLGARAVVPALRVRGGGAIVVTASTAGLVPSALNPVYTLTKHGVVGFVRALAPNLEHDRITVNAVCPSFVDTPLTTNALGGVDAASVGLATLTADEVARVAVNLATTPGTGRCIAMEAGSEPREWLFTV